MKSSRVMLLAAIFSSAVSFGSETPATSAAVPANAETVAPATAATTPAASEAPVVTAPETSATVATEETKTPAATTPSNPGFLAAKWAFITGAAASATNFASKPAVWALSQLTRISYLKGGKFEANIPTMGKVITAAALVAAAYAVYQQMNDETDVDNTPIFE